MIQPTLPASTVRAASNATAAESITPRCLRAHLRVRLSSVDGPGEDRLVSQEPSQVAGHFLGRGVALFGVLGHRLEHDGFQIGGHCLVDLAHGPRFFDRDLPQQLVTVMAVERRLEGQKLIEGCAQ